VGDIRQRQGNKEVEGVVVDLSAEQDEDCSMADGPQLFTHWFSASTLAHPY
jgi:hypothetical protein